MDHLSTEPKAFEADLQSLLGASEGKFVLIRGDEIVGVFDHQMDAISSGYSKFGNAPFLVKQILKVDMPISFVSNLLAVEVTGCHPSRFSCPTFKVWARWSTYVSSLGFRWSKLFRRPAHSWRLRQ